LGCRRCTRPINTTKHASDSWTDQGGRKRRMGTNAKDKILQIALAQSPRLLFIRFPHRTRLGVKLAPYGSLQAVGRFYSPALPRRDRAAGSGGDHTNNSFRGITKIKQAATRTTKVSVWKGDVGIRVPQNRQRKVPGRTVVAHSLQVSLVISQANSRNSGGYSTGRTFAAAAHRRMRDA